MLTEIQDRVCVFAAIDYDMVPIGRVHNAVEGILKRIKPKKMAASPIHCLFRLAEQHGLLSLSVKRLNWEFLGLSHWKDHLEEYVSISNAALETLGVQKFSRIGFKVMAFLRLGMTHAEMSRLMFGTFLPEQEDLAPVLDQAEDPLVQFHGKRADLDYLLTLTAMTKAEITNTFHQIPEIAHFLDDKYLDDSLRVFHDRISTEECFFFDVDFFRTNAPSRDLSGFFSSSMAEADSLARVCVDHLRAKPSRK